MTTLRTSDEMNNSCESDIRFSPLNMRLILWQSRVLNDLRNRPPPRALRTYPPLESGGPEFHCPSSGRCRYIQVKASQRSELRRYDTSSFLSAHTLRWRSLTSTTRR